MSKVRGDVALGKNIHIKVRLSLGRRKSTHLPFRYLHRSPLIAAVTAAYSFFLSSSWRDWVALLYESKNFFLDWLQTSPYPFINYIHVDIKNNVQISSRDVDGTTELCPKWVASVTYLQLWALGIQKTHPWRTLRRGMICQRPYRRGGPAWSGRRGCSSLLSLLRCSRESVCKHYTS